MVTTTLPYQRVFTRLHAEFVALPALGLTPEQVARLCGADREVCRRVLHDLVRARFLRLGVDGVYRRAVASPSRLAPNQGRSRPFAS